MLHLVPKRGAALPILETHVCGQAAFTPRRFARLTLFLLQSWNMAPPCRHCNFDFLWDHLACVCFDARLPLYARLSQLANPAIPGR
jgi:hypothetical protein